jgi:tetratricopeptide (TPR) repeat protein
MNEKYTIEELEAYLFGDLAPERKKDLDSEIESDAALKEELEALKISREAIELAGWKALISRNQEEFLATREDPKVKQIQSRPSTTGVWLGRIAASLLFILIGSASVLFFSTTSDSILSDQLDYSIPVLRSAESNLDQIEEAFQAKDFDQVLTLSSSVEGFDAKAYFLIGLSYLELENGAKAEEYFTKIESENLKTSERNYADQVDYYLVNAYLLQDKPEDAELRIDKIMSDENHTYHGNFNQFDRLKVKILKLK